MDRQEAERGGDLTYKDGQFLLQTGVKARKQRGTSGEDDVLVHRCSYVLLALHDRIVDNMVNPGDVLWRGRSGRSRRSQLTWGGWARRGGGRGGRRSGGRSGEDGEGGGLKEGFGTSKSFITNGEQLTIRELVASVE